MEDSSDDDDKPLGERKLVNATAKLLATDSDDESPIPEWISQNTPEKPAINLNDSDSSNDDMVDLTTQPSAHKKAEPKHTQPKEGAGTGKKVSAVAQALAKAGAEKKGGKTPASGSKLPPAGASQALGSKVSAMPDAAPGAEIPIQLPETIQGLRYLVELEENSEGRADLAGDAGAVGRFSLSGGSGKEQEMLLDLKGRIYNTSLVECASTFCVVNLQANEAKVEAVFDSYVSLWEDEQHAAGMDNKAIFMYDDDEADAYQVGPDDKQSQKPGKRKAKDDNEDVPKAKRKQLAKPANVKKKAATKPKAGGKGAAKGKKK